MLLHRIYGAGNRINLTIPQGFTLAGLCGSSGDSLDALGLLIAPNVPRCPVHLAEAGCPSFLARCPLHFQLQAAALQEGLRETKVTAPHLVDLLVGVLFKVTFYAPDEPA